MQVRETTACAFDHFVQGREGSVAEVVFAEVVPEVLYWIEFRAVGWQGEQLHAGRNLQTRCPVPPCAVQDQEAVVVGETVGRVSQEQ